MHVCPNCSRENPEKAKFCGYCGSKFDAPRKTERLDDLGFDPIAPASSSTRRLSDLGFDEQAESNSTRRLDDLGFDLNKYRSHSSR